MSKLPHRVAVAVLSSLVFALSGCPASNGADEGQAEVLKALKADAEARQREYAALARRVDAVDQKVQDVLTALEFLAVDVDGIKRNTWDIVQQNQATGERTEPEPPEGYRKLFAPETRVAVEKAAAEKGIKLLADRIEVPAVVIQNRAMLEFFAVSSGGKEHEAVIAVTGNVEHGKGRAEGLPGMLNACILALGYQRGKPVRSSPDGKLLPPEGEPIHIYIEYESGGEKVRARAEDLVYCLDRKTSMARNKWVYVGSGFERDYATSDVVYVADLTGDLVATYSWPYTVIDNTTLEAGDDVYYTCFTPRIPPIGTVVTLVLSRDELPAKEFPDWKEEVPPGKEPGK